MSSEESFLDVPDEPLLNIKAVSQTTGIESVTLRAWERRYGVPMPKRTDQGYRLYSERDVSILTWLKAKIEDGLTIKRAVALLRSQAPQRADQLHQQTPAVLSPQVDSGVEVSANLDELVEALIDSVHRFDTIEAQQIIKQAFVMYPVEKVCLELLLPVLSHIGDEWEAGNTSLQVEHFTTHMIRQQLLALGATMPSPWRPGRVVAGCAPDDWHEMGILMLSLFLRRRGWEVIFLGQAVGLDRLTDTLQTIKPDVLLLSSGYLDTAVNLLTAAELTLQHDSAIWFAYGGTLFRHAPELIGSIPGVYAGPTLIDGRDRIDGLLSGMWEPEPDEAPEVSEDVFACYHNLKAISLTVTDGVAGLLMEADPTLSTDEATQTARHVVGALIAALRFNLPELQNSKANAARYRLHKSNVERAKLEDVLTFYVGLEHLPTLAPFIDAIYQ